MAYGLKYYNDFTSQHYQRLVRVEILERDYSGNSERIKMGASIHLSDSGDGREQPIKKLTASLRLLSERNFQFEHLFTADDKKYQVRINRGGVTVFIGFLESDSYSEPYYTDRNYSITLTARDNLGRLEDIDYLNSDGDRYHGLEMARVIISRVLERTGYFLNIFDEIDIFSSDMNQGGLTTQQTYLNNDAFWNYEDNKPRSCLYVLEEILKGFGAQIRQVPGGWRIVEQGKYYDRDFHSETTWINQDSELVIQPALKSIILNQNYNRKADISHAFPIKENQFSFISGNAWSIEGWSTTAPGFYHKEGDLAIIPLTSGLYVVDNYQTTFNVRAVSIDIAFNFKLWKFSGSGGNVNNDVHIDIINEDKILTSSGWVDYTGQEKQLTFNFATDFGRDNAKEIIAIASGIPNTGNLTVKIWDVYDKTSIPVHCYGFFVNAYESDNADVYSSSAELQLLIDDNNNTKEDFDINIGEVSGGLDANYIYDGGVFDQNGEAQVNWKRPSDTITRGLLENVARGYYLLNKQTSRQVTGTVLWDYDIWTNIDDQGKRLMINSVDEWNLNTDQLTAEFIEVFEYSASAEPTFQESQIVDGDTNSYFTTDGSKDFLAYTIDEGSPKRISDLSIVTDLSGYSFIVDKSTENESKRVTYATLKDLILGGVDLTDYYTKSESDAKFHPLNGSTTIDFSTRLLTSNGLATFNAGLIVNGDIIQNGSSYVTHAENVEVESNLMQLNVGEPGSQITGVIPGTTIPFSGIEINRGTGEAYYMGVVEGATPLLKLGKKDSLVAIAARADSISDDFLLSWDLTNKRIVGKRLASDYWHKDNSNKSDVDWFAKNTISYGYASVVGVSYLQGTIYAQDSSEAIRIRPKRDNDKSPFISFYTGASQNRNGYVQASSSGYMQLVSENGNYLRLRSIDSKVEILHKNSIHFNTTDTGTKTTGDHEASGYLRASQNYYLGVKSGNRFGWNGSADVSLQYAGRGSGGRAFVHNSGNKLAINFANDFDGGTEIQSNLFVQHNIQNSGTYESGFAGSGWRIDSAGNAEFDNLEVRKGLTIHELLIAKERSINGGFVVSVANCEVKEVAVTADDYIITVKNAPTSFIVGDRIRCQNYSGSVKYYEGRISWIKSDGSVFSIPKSSIEGGGVPAVDDSLVQWGHVTDTSRQGMLYMTARGNNAPYYSVLSGVNSSNLANKEVIRIGNLGGYANDGYGIASKYGGKTYFELSNTTKSIAGWNFTNNSFHSTNSKVMIHKTNGFIVSDTAIYEGNVFANNDRVNLYYYSDTDWGITGKKGGDILFRLGYINQIAGITFDREKLTAGNIQIWKTGDIINTAVGTPYAFYGNGNFSLGKGQIGYNAATNVLSFADSVKLQWENYTNSAVDAIEIGGRNLLKNSADEKNTIRFTIFTVWDIFAGNIGREVTISFDMKCSIARGITVYAYQSNGISIANSKIFTVTEANKYERFSFTTTVKDYGDNGIYSDGEVAFYDYVGEQNYSIKNIKVEWGNKATDWTPSLGDVDTNITTITNNTIQTTNLLAENLRVNFVNVQDFAAVTGTIADWNIHSSSIQKTSAYGYISLDSENVAIKMGKDDYLLTIGRTYNLATSDYSGAFGINCVDTDEGVEFFKLTSDVRKIGGWYFDGVEFYSQDGNIRLNPNTGVTLVNANGDKVRVHQGDLSNLPSSEATVFNASINTASSTIYVSGTSSFTTDANQRVMLNFIKGKSYQFNYSLSVSGYGTLTSPQQGTQERGVSLRVNINVAGKVVVIDTSATILVADNGTFSGVLDLGASGRQFLRGISGSWHVECVTVSFGIQGMTNINKSFNTTLRINQFVFDSEITPTGARWVKSLDQYAEITPENGFVHVNN